MLEYSFVIPVYNRPVEIKELLDSFLAMKFEKKFEIVIVEDGSTERSDFLIENYSDKLDISYYFKENSGPGSSRNYGMERAKGNYFIILDSDVILPENYLSQVDAFLQKTYVDVFGGPDDAHESFSDLQKAINFVMTSFITTGGIRGGKAQIGKFQPRSFNMGISKRAFESTGGFGRVHPGEDPDLTMRLWAKGFESSLIPLAKVFHKRRISWSNFRRQVYKFGVVRPILNKWHKGSAKITYWFPTMFSLYTIVSLAMVQYCVLPFALLLTYLLVLFILSSVKNSSVKIGFMSVYAAMMQFFAYGYGFLLSNIKLNLLSKNEEEAFPGFFFKKV